MAKLYFRYGSMNCGKSTAIIQVAYNYEEKGKKVIIIKPKVDTKGGNCVINRNNLKREVDYLIDTKDSIASIIEPDIAAILVDEAEYSLKSKLMNYIISLKLKIYPYYAMD